MNASIRLGNGAGFWGDRLDAPLKLVETGDLDYLTLEYLAELTLSILAHQKEKQAGLGYVTDFTHVIKTLLPLFNANPKLKIVTNAGGLNPHACAKMVAQDLVSAGLGNIAIGIVAGDDVLSQLDNSYLQANAYLGADGIVSALKQDARIVITGRVADASLVVGPAQYEFDWQNDAYDHLAQATVAGHLIECGAQVTGGLFTKWHDVEGYDTIGYPIATINTDASVQITKPENSGGLVSIETVSEQLVYEIGDPAHYLTPDVDVDFTTIRLNQEGPNLVGVSGATGQKPPETYKVASSKYDGYIASDTVVIFGRNADQKAHLCDKIIQERLTKSGFKPEKYHCELLGMGGTVPGWHTRANPEEVVLKITVKDAKKRGRRSILQRNETSRDSRITRGNRLHWPTCQTQTLVRLSPYDDFQTICFPSGRS